MQRYFFDLFNGRKLDRDTDGAPFETLADARTAAMTLLAEIAKEECQERRNLNMTIRLRDGSGRYRFETTLAMTSRDLTGAVVEQITTDYEQ